MLNIRKVFETKSMIQVIVLCIITFGLYVVFRLFTLTAQASPHIKNPIPSWFIVSAISVHLISFFSLVYFFIGNGSYELFVFSKAMHVISSLFHVIWLIKIRNRINSISGGQKGSQVWLNPFLSTFFHVIYIQYKINQSADVPNS